MFDTIVAVRVSVDDTHSDCERVVVGLRNLVGVRVGAKVAVRLGVSDTEASAVRDRDRDTTLVGVEEGDDTSLEFDALSDPLGEWLSLADSELLTSRVSLGVGDNDSVVSLVSESVSLLEALRDALGSLLSLLERWAERLSDNEGLDVMLSLDVMLLRRVGLLPRVMESWKVIDVLLEFDSVVEFVSVSSGDREGERTTVRESVDDSEGERLNELDGVGDFVDDGVGVGGGVRVRDADFDSEKLSEGVVVLDDEGLLDLLTLRCCVDELVRDVDSAADDDGEAVGVSERLSLALRLELKLWVCDELVLSERELER